METPLWNTNFVPKRSCSEIEKATTVTKTPQEIKLDKLMTDLRKKENQSSPIDDGKITLDEAIEQEIQIQVSTIQAMAAHLVKVVWCIDSMTL